MTNARLLISAADAAHADELARRAESIGCEVTGKAHSGKEAESLSESLDPDLVLMEAQPGEIHEVAKVLMKIQHDLGIPVVIVADSDEAIPVAREGRDHPYGILPRSSGIVFFREVIETAIYRHAAEHKGKGDSQQKKRYRDATVRKTAHDINNSLSSALANIQLARRSVNEDDLCRHLDDAEKSVFRAHDQSRQLLAPESISEKMEIRRRPDVLAHSRTPVKKKGVTAGYRILLMDDEDAILSATSEMLSFLGHTVTIAKSGEDAIELFRAAEKNSTSFEAVILDITVPGGFGAEQTLPVLREIDPEVQAIISSGYATHPLLISFEASGFVAALIKPYGFKELEESLAHIAMKKKL